jgi:hypothetical protein
MKRLTEKHFSFRCPMNWDEMEVSAHGRFCNSCRKEVFDLTNCSIEEVRVLQQKHGSICGSIRLMSVAAVAAVSFSTAACKKEQVVKGKLDPPPAKPERQSEGEVPILMGEIAPPPEPKVEQPKPPAMRTMGFVCVEPDKIEKVPPPTPPERATDP